MRDHFKISTEQHRKDTQHWLLGSPALLPQITSENKEHRKQKLRDKYNLLGTILFGRNQDLLKTMLDQKETHKWVNLVFTEQQYIK